MQKTLKSKLYTTYMIPLIFIFSILLAREYVGHVLFHSLAELFSILVGLMMIVIVSYTYQFTKNNFLLYLGIGYFWVAILDLFHMLTYPGMSIYPALSANTMLTFWLSARLFEAFILTSALFVNIRTLSKSKIFIIFGLISAGIYYLAFSKYAPVLYTQGSGLTSLKINLEYAIVLILMISIYFYVRSKKDFDKSIYYYIIASIILTIFTELILTFYAKVDDSFTVLAHLLKFLSYWMIFLSIIKTSLEKPFKFLAHESDTYNSIPFPSILVDEQGIIRQINDSTATFLNLRKEQILNQNNHMLFHDINIEENECTLCKAIKNGKILPLSSIQRDTATYSCSVNPIIVEDVVMGSAQVCLDISKQIEKDIALKESEEKFRGLFENSEVSIWQEDLTDVVKILEELKKEGVTDILQHLTQNIPLAQEIAMKVKVVDINAATLKLFKTDSKEHFLSGIDKTFGDNAIEVFIDELNAIWKKEDSFTKEAFFRTFDNEIIQGIVTFQIPKKLEQFSNISVNIIDISHIKKVENELKITNDKLESKKTELETIIKEAPNPIMIHNEEGKVLLINKVWEQLTGYVYKDIDTISKWTQKAYGKDMPVVKECIDKLYLLEHKIDEGEYPIITSDKKIITWQFSSAPLGIIDGKRTVISSAMDITELKQKDEMLINQSRQAAMGEMIGMIAHQWRQPLSTISMISNNILLDIELGNYNTTQVKKYSQNITEQTKHLSKTIDDFRNFFKSDKIIIKSNIKTVLDQTFSMLGESLKNYAIEIQISYETQKEIDVYPRELMQVFLNIIANAKDALIQNNPDKPIISIRVYADEKYVNTEICDNAGGIDNDILPHVFDPYFSTKDNKNGTGVGLYMSKSIVEGHLNGKIEVVNKDNGACFTVRLPS